MTMQVEPFSTLWAKNRLCLLMLRFTECLLRTTVVVCSSQILEETCFFYMDKEVHLISKIIVQRFSCVEVFVHLKCRQSTARDFFSRSLCRSTATFLIYINMSQTFELVSLSLSHTDDVSSYLEYVDLALHLTTHFILNCT